MKISILTPSYNAAKYLPRAIESVLKQDYKNWEHVVMDGGSSDGTVNILERYPHLVWSSEKDKGQSHAMNKAFARSTGEIIIYLNADDELGDGLLSFMVEQFKANPAVDMVVGDLVMQFPDQTIINKPYITLKKILYCWPGIFPLNPVSYAYKRSLQLKIGAFPEDDHYAMDYWFLLRAFLYGNIKQTDFVCGTFHLDGRNKSSDLERARVELKKVRDRFLLEFFYTKPVVMFVLRNIAKKVYLKLNPEARNRK
jgi:glycosyltransferase involved in cell wall biosynthesis